MKREIKFRGKTATGEWVYGTYHYSNNGRYHYILSREMFITIDGRKSLHGAEVFNVIEESVGQYTGWIDENGIEVYEGDKIIPSVGDFKGKEKNIFYRMGSPAYDFYGGQGNVNTWELNELNSFGVLRCKVVGNIYENPELLK